MDDLSPNARTLLSQLRQGERPDLEARTRVRRALRVSVSKAAGLTLLGAAGVANASGALAAGSASTATALGAVGAGVATTGAATFAQVATSLLLGALAGLGVAAPVSYLAERSAPAAVQQTHTGTPTTRAVSARVTQPEQPQQPRSVSPVASNAATAATEKVPTPAALAPTRGEPRAPSSDTLADETRLLERARGRLKAGQAEESLRLLEQYQRAFPGGALGEEAAASKVVALCALGRRREAERGVRQFQADFPHSPLHPRVASVCGGDEP